MPFQKLLAPLAKIAFDLGGTSGTLGTQKEPSVFYSPNTKTTVGVAVCYESIYGEYIGEYVQKGAQLIFIITNDGWWYDTPGYRQHLCYARLRAVETRRCIARSANTGISAFINEKGDILEKTNWWVPAALKATIDANSSLTFYAVHGDYFGRYSCVLSALMLIFLAYTIIRKRK
jgi:apolipoprotein N-acyltransferase